MDAERFLRVLGEFHDLYPSITFQLIEHGTKKIEEDVLHDRLDVGVTSLPTEEEAFHYFPFMQESLRVVFPRKHPLSYRKQVSLSELEDEAFILFNKDFALNDLIMNACKDIGFLQELCQRAPSGTLLEN